MAVRRIRAGGGLSTDPSALDQPEGLRVADNVLLHRPGTIQPRPGFGDTTGIASRVADHRPIAIVPFGGDLVVQNYDSVLDQVGLNKGSADASFSSGESLALPSVNGVSSFMEARGSLYYTSAEGVKKLADIADTATTKAGAWMTYQPPELSTAPATDIENAALEVDTSVAYRWCVVRTDANGYEIRSAPSSRTVWASLSDASYPNGLNMNVGEIYLPPEAAEGDVLELYRTPNSGDRTADPGEDYYLVGEYTVTSADISAGSIVTVWEDNVKDHELGAALYTSSAQFGALSSKEIPPYTASLAWWGGVAWAGYLFERALETVTLAKVAFYDTGAAVAVNEDTGLCTLEGAYTGVSGNTLTGVTFPGSPSVLGWGSLLAGQWISDTNPTSSLGRIPLGTRIVSFDEGAQTITLDQTPSGTGDFNAGDIVEIQSVEFYAYASEGLSSRWFDVTHSDLYQSREYQAALSLARAVTAYFAGAVTPPPAVYAFKDEVSVNGDGGLVFLAASPGTQFTLQSIRGSAFVPDLTTEITVEPTERAGGIAWSAPQEPEAWPPANTLTVGQRHRAVLAMVPTRDALLVWKEDGLYAITGAPPSSWVVNEVDSSLRLVAPEAVCVLDGVCFALTDRGVVAATAGGVQIVSGPIASDLRAYTRLLPRDNADHKRAFWMVAHQRLGLVVLGVGESADADYTDTEYVFHARASGRWSRWPRADRCAAYDPAEDRMVVSPGIDAWELLYERTVATAGAHTDVVLSLLSASRSGSDVTISVASFGGYEPRPGDVLRDSEGLETDRVTAVSTVGSDYVLTVTGTGVTSTVSWFQSIPCTVEWQPQHLPGRGSRWQEVHVTLESDASAYVDAWPLDVGGQPSEATSASTVTATVTSSGAPYQAIRVGLPRAIVRAYQMGPRIEVSCAGVLWRVAELALHVTGQSRRIRR